MNNHKLALSFLLVSLSSATSAAEIYKCNIDDKVVFQDFPCAEDYEYGLTELDTFDGWKYGMNILAFKKRSKLKNIPINTGTSILYNQYNEKYLNKKPDARIFSYSTKVAGESAKVSLFFTKKSQSLYRIQVNIFVISMPAEEKEYFYTSLVNQLTKKYSQYIEAKDYPSTANILSKFILQDTVGTEKIWGANSDNIISLTGNTTLATSYRLNYKYIPLIKKNIAETTDEIRLSTDKAFSKDSIKL
ncbi:hypothetical protein [Photobacterium sp. GB-3]|uniref:hypothetical protein n=1 Tax=Photobacterium sp. GB-3 TaxID=2022110 RepID=UPI000D17A55B|nr:hypothetical protein [Photobacterium sp. GB-3]PSV56518.1 hypothetical protein C9J43_10530 [Photobacterium sp. GB-3]